MAAPIRDVRRLLEAGRRSKPRARRWATAILIPCLALVVAELALRLVEGRDGLFRVPDRWRHHALVPLRTRNERWGDARYTVSTNSLGMRDRSCARVPLAKGNARRVLFLGDSFTEGIGVEFDETVPALVGRALRSAAERAGNHSARPIECLNAGLSSYSPLLEERTMRELLARGLEFDHLVLLVDTSDPQDELLYRRELGLAAPGMPTGTVTAEPERELFYTDAGLWGYSHSALVRKLWRTSRHFEPRWIWRDGARRDREAWATDPDLIARWGEQGIALMLESLDRIVELARRAGVSVHLVIYPWPYQIEAGRASPRAPAVMEEQVAAFCSSRGVPLINLYPHFLARENWGALFVSGDVHWSPAGHRLVAGAIAEELSPDDEPLRAAEGRPNTPPR